MTFLPVVERELRVAARRRATYWGRFTSGLIGVALVAWILLTTSDDEKKLGAELFAIISALVFIYATVAGMLVTCDCLSEEKREGTLGLLFLTDLKGHDVVLGKLAATSVNAFYGMLALLPLLAIPFLVGGVAHGEMLRVVLVSINLLLFFLSIGLFVSALCRKDNWALGLCIMIALAMVLGGPIATQFRSLPWQNAAMLSSPATGCFLAFDTVYNDPKEPEAHSHFWYNAAATQLYGWIFFGLACRIVPRSWQDAAFGKKTSWRPVSAGIQRAKARSQLLEINPFTWRVARFTRRWLVSLMLAAQFVLWLWYSRSYSLNYWETGADFFLLIPAGLVLKAWLAAEASRTISEDRRSGGLELLLSTPLSEREIIRGQLTALWRQFAWPVAAVLAAYLVFLMGEIKGWTAEERMDLLMIHLLCAGFLVADLIALSWVAMWLGLINRKPNRAALLALTRILVLPGVLFCVLISLWALARQGNGSPESAAFTLWFILGLLADCYFGFTAYSRLRAEFRTIVAEGLARKQPAEAAPKAAPVLAEAP